MNELYNIVLDKNSAVPLYQQLADRLYAFISEGVLEANYRLPAVRPFARALQVNPGTIVNAYKLLERKRMVYSREGSGTYVTDISKAAKAVVQVIHKNKQELNNINAINFSKTSVSENLFPVSKFKVIFNKILDRDKGKAFGYQNIRGYEPLREAICEKLEDKSIKASPDRIQIISGSQQGIDIVSKALLENNDVVFVEHLTYLGAVGAMLSRNAQIVQVDMEQDGINIKSLKTLLTQYSPRFIYISTYYQTPSCITYSLKKKRELLELAIKYNFYIIEEDNLSDFIYSDNKPVTLKALDYKNRVIYIKSFSKILMPGLRLGYMLLPRAISESVANIKYSTDISTSGFLQRGFEMFLKSSAWEEHILYMRSIFKQKHNIIVNEIENELLPWVSFTPPMGGLNVWLRVRDKNTDMKKLYEIFAKNNVIVIPGEVYAVDDEQVFAFGLSFADVEDHKITEGIHKIAQGFREYYQ